MKIPVRTLPILPGFARLYIRISFLLFVLVGDIFAQRLNIRVYNVPDGLVQSQVKTILQDDDGYLWIGTMDGLSKFDGHTFENFTRENGLPDNYITSSFKDTQGHLWFSFATGVIAQYNWQTKQFEIVVSLQDSSHSSLPFITGFLREDDGTFWISTATQGLYCFRDSTLTRYTDRNGLPGNSIHAMLMDRFHRLWLGTNSGVTILRTSQPIQKNSFLTLTSEHGLIKGAVFSLVSDLAGDIWVGTTRGISRVHLKSADLSPSAFSFQTIQKGLRQPVTIALLADRSGMVWAGSPDSGITILKADTFSNKVEIIGSISRKNGLSRNRISALFQDREGNYWIGTDGGGVCMFRDRRLELYTVTDGLPDNSVWSFCEDTQGNTWIGSEEGLTRLFYPTKHSFNRQITHYTSIGKIPVRNVYGLLADREGYIWITSSPYVTIRLNPETEAYQIFKRTSRIPWDETITMEEDSSGSIWFGTFSSGLIRYSLETHRAELYTTEHGLSGNGIRVLYCDRSGDLWIGISRHPLMVYRNGKFQTVTPENGTPLYSVTSIAQDSRGDLWMAANDGELIRYDGHFAYNYSRLATMKNTRIYSLVVDNKDQIWLGTIRGVKIFHPQDSTLRQLGGENGSLISESNQNACYLDHSGNIWFGTINGAVKYNPNEIHTNRVPPLIHLKKMRLFWNEVPLKPNAQFSYRKNYITFYYTGISLYQPEEVYYKYILEGFDPTWSPPTQEDHATYSNLPPGSYTFKVKACNANNIWSEEAATYHFIIKAPFWQKWWFILLSVLFVAIVVASLHQYRVGRIAYQKEVLEKRVQERTAEIVRQKEKLEKAYDALLESETKFRVFTETTSSAIVIIQKARFRYVNPASEKLTGYPLSEFLNLTLKDLVHPDDHRLIEEIDRQTREKPDEWYHNEFRILTKSGEERYISFTARIITYEGKTALLVTAFDITERRRMEEDLRQLTRAVETTPVAMVLTDLKGKINYVNRGFLIHCCLSCSENALQHNIMDFFDQEGKQLLQEEIFPSLIQKQEWNGEIRILPQKGEPFHAEMVCSVVTDANNQPVHFLFHFLNIEERKRNEQFLKESMESYRELFNSIPEAIYVQDKDGKFLDVNEGAVKMYGYPKEFFIGKTPLVLGAPGMVDIEKTIQFLKEAFKGKPQKFEWWGRRKNGEIFPKEVLLTRSHYFGKEVALAIARDITERKKFEEMIQEEKERLAVTLRSIGDGVVTTDTEGKIVLMNPVAEKLTGWSQQEAIGQPFEKVFHLSYANGNIDNPVHKVMNAGQVIRLSEEAVLIARDGTERMVSHNGAPIRDQESNIIGVVLVLRDITEKKQLEQEQLKGQKLESIGILAGGIAHDFNNILTAVLGNISLARMLVKDNPKVSKRLAEAEIATMRAKDLTQQLLTFSKGGAPVKETASIADIIRDSVSFTLSGSSILCEPELPEDLWSVEVDTGQISQVIQNLIINAQQSMPNGGTIEVKAENLELNEKSGLPLPPGKYVKITVKDEGIGIPEEHLDKIFDPYFTTKKQGNGLGLATSYSIIKRHNGLITVDSVLGQGSSFYIYLPAAGKQIKHKKFQEYQIAHGSGKILIMDDEELVQDVASEILSELGYQVEVASDGMEALEKYRRAKQTGEAFDVVIMDLTIPGGVGGKIAIQEFKKFDPEVKAIVASGYSSDPIIANYTEYGFVGCVRKPFTVKELNDTLTRILSG